MASKQEVVVLLKGHFPQLETSNFEITSPTDTRYNCIAWAVNDNTRWWWPDPSAYWPTMRGDLTIENFEEAFATLGYIRCETTSSPEDVERILLYIDSNGKPEHAARQLVSGDWAAKIGPQWDVEHQRNAFCGGTYGNGTVMFERPRRR